MITKGNSQFQFNNFQKTQSSMITPAEVFSEQQNMIQVDSL